MIFDLKKRIAAFLRPSGDPKPPTLPPARGAEISYVDSYLYGSYAPTPYNPDDLAGKRGLEIYSQIRNDPQVKAALTIKKLAVVGSGFEIIDATYAETDAHKAAEAKQIGNFIRFALEEMDGSVQSNLLAILTALDYGFSVTEIVMAPVAYGDFEGKIFAKALKTRRPFGFDFYIDGHGNLIELLQNRHALPPERFLIYSYGDEFSNFYGRSDLRAAFDGWWMKKNLQRFLTMMLERHGMPTIKITTDGILQTQQQTALQNYIDNLQTKTGIILPKGVTIDLLEPARGAGDTFLPALRYCDDQMRIALLMPGLVGMSSEQATGSLARASVEFDSFVLIVNALRTDLETLLNERLIKNLVDLNFEISDGKYPRFAFKTMTDAQKQQLFQLWLQAVASGAVTSRPEDEQKLRSTAGMEPLSDEEIETRKNAAEDAQDAADEKQNLDIADKTQQQIEKMERRLYGKTLGEVMAERVQAGAKWANGSVGVKVNSFTPCR